MTPAPADPRPPVGGEAIAAMERLVMLGACYAEANGVDEHDDLHRQIEAAKATILAALRAAPAGEAICYGWAVIAPNGGVLVERVDRSPSGALCIYGTEWEARAAMPKGCTLARVTVTEGDRARAAAGEARDAR